MTRDVLDIVSPGKARAGADVVVMVSHSGNTQECVAAAKLLVARGITTLAVTGNAGWQ